MARRKKRDIMTAVEPESEWLYKCSLQRVVDGDTVDLDVDTGFGIHFNMRVRLYGFNAPERRKPGGPEATAHLILLLQGNPAKEVVLASKELFFESIRDRKGKYGRYLGILWINLDSAWVCVNRRMVEAGHTR